MREVHVLNLGAGVQSTTLYLLAREGRVPCDVAIFADTGEEPAAVYRHLEWLRSLGEPKILVRSAGCLGDDLIHGRGPTKRFVSIPAFTLAADGKIGRVPRQCTKEYKVETVERAIRRDVLGLAPGRRCPADLRIVQSFGISADEAGRARRTAERFATKKWTVAKFPLLDLGWTRRDCLDWLKDRTPHPVPRSACVFCPFRDNAAWLRLKQSDSDAWRRAVAIDAGMRDEDSVCRRGFRQPLFVHRSCRPLAEVDFERLASETLDPMTAECHGMCGV